MSTNDKDVEGLLFGTIIQQMSALMDDGPSEANLAQLTTGIQEFRMTGSNCSFYQHSGQLNPQVLRSITPSSNEHKLLGWFKFRRNTPLRPSLREKCVCQHLAQATGQPIVFGIFSTTISPNNATHTLDYRFLIVHGKHTIPIELEITNLVSSSQTEYNDFNPLSISNFSSLGSRGSTKMPDDLVQLERFFEEKLKEIEETALQVHNTTKEIRRLQQEIKDLQ
eukprot:TRINITY_DN8511_c0_g1_i1.p1 TRINITY_DN8511_c0_g1~~TRINITY_DN8511_c0_g1_i1.p1  ORF type:complete len:243 (+),score=36.05 TRINITY_DN8511_c0_g1_i1:62-730(+)